MMWLEAIPVVALGAIITILPGLLPLRLVGVRGLALAALAPVVGTAVAASAAIVLGLMGVPWTAWSYAVVIVIVALLALGLRRVLGDLRSSPPGTTRTWAIPVALGIGMLLSAWGLIAYIGAPDGISQTNDAIFHLNAVRYAVESGSASSLTISSFTGSSGFYPAAWHALVSMLVQTTGAELPLAANAITLVIGAIIWPAGIAWLARVISARVSVAAYAAVLSSALQVFPLLMFQWGVLYPNALSVAFLPAAIAAVVTVPMWFDRSRPTRSGVLLAIVLAAVAGALLLSQPSTFLAWGLVCAVWLSFHLLRSRSSITQVALRTFGVVAVWGALAGIWAVFADSTSGSHWPTFRGKLEATTDVLLNRQMEFPAAYVISVIMLAGLIACLCRARWRWVILAWAGLSALYVAVASVGSPFVRDWLLGPWYADPNRIAALAPVLVIPLAAIGLDALVRGAQRVIRAEGVRPRRVAPIIGLVAAVVLVAVMMAMRSPATPSFTEGVFYPDSRYTISDETFLSVDERALLESLPGVVEDGERIIGNPSTGIGFGYALAGLDVYPMTWSQPTSDAWTTISSGLRDVATDPAVCEALGSLGDPGYVLDFGVGEAGPGRFVLPGMSGFAGQPGFELVSGTDDASLWRITACASG